MFLLFLLGGLVRVTGSGMGCPDWPKCFGLVMPPTCTCQLPDNYMEIFLQKRIAKVDRFASVLEKVGMREKAQLLRTDKRILEPEFFNATKAWIEYINRLFGVVAGLLCLLFFVQSIKHRQQKGVLLFATLGLLMLVANAWLGSLVVATNLLPGIVSLHFMLSFLCMFFVLLAVHKHQPFQKTAAFKSPKWVWPVLFTTLMLEVFLGTIAREKVEYLQSIHALSENSGMLNLNRMGSIFVWHRFLPAFIFAMAAMLYYKGRNAVNYPDKLGFALLALLSLIQICFGAFNVVFTLPPWSQVLHIVLGSFLPLVAFYFLLLKRVSPGTANTIKP